jgi:hypothetical protein
VFTRGKVIAISEIEQQKQVTTEKMILVVMGQDIAPHKQALLASPTHKERVRKEETVSESQAQSI